MLLGISCLSFGLSKRPTFTTKAFPVMISAVEAALADLLERCVARPVMILATWAILADNFKRRPLLTGH